MNNDCDYSAKYLLTMNIVDEKFRNFHQVSMHYNFYS